MKIVVDRKGAVATTYRAERARGLFNVSEEDGAGFHLEVRIPVEQDDWQIGVVVGSSGSGKSSIGAELVQNGFVWFDHMPSEFPGVLIDQVTTRIGHEGFEDTGASFDKVTGVLTSVGLGSVPAWLRPYEVLSNGESFRADMAYLLLQEDRTHVVVDEFTSVLDRTVACTGAAAFAKAWRKRGIDQIALLTCHHDVVDWIEPDWVCDTDKKITYFGKLSEEQAKHLDEYPEVGRLVIKK